MTKVSSRIAATSKTSLGLYLVRTLVEGYGGKVWVEGRVKDDHTKGARFVVMLPAVNTDFSLLENIHNKLHDFNFRH